MSLINHLQSLRSLVVVTVGLCVLSFTAVGAGQEGAMDQATMDKATMDHATMDHSEHSMSTARDAEGRILYGMKHKMDPALTAELRKTVALYKDYTDAQITLSMDMMGAEYAWYISPAGLKGTQGVLILLHGFREQGDKMFRNQVQPIGDIFPTALGVGMAMMMSDHIQVALDELTAAGATTIAVVPITSSATNELHRQWMYIFGKQEKPEFSSVSRVKTDAKLLFADPPGDDPLVAEILLDHALELSQDTGKELVFVVGHGPSSAEDNAEELRVLSGLAKIVKQDGGFFDVRGMTLQDDAPTEIRDANVNKLREAIDAAARSGQRVIVVTNLISTRSVQAKLRSDLKGLQYEFSSKGLVNHPNFMKWMTQAVRSQFIRDQMKHN